MKTNSSVWKVTWTGVCEEADEQGDVVHGVEMGPNILDTAGQLGSVTHVVLKRKNK